MYIYVQDKDGRPLMPTERYRAVRHWLRDGKAVIASHTPFTVRLTGDTAGYVLPLTLGVDAGSRHVGLSVTSGSTEYYTAEVELRSDIPGNLSTRREARKTRRAKRCRRYRAPRFDNRRATKRHGWLAPSVRQKAGTHLSAIENVLKVLPVKKIVIETAQFDMQKIKNPDIAGTQYQEGPQTNFWNVREYVLWRDGHTCRCCHGKTGDKILNVHHVESRKTGGDSPDNLVTLCETCHKAYHAGKLEIKLRRNFKSLRDAAVMNILRWKVLREAERRFPDANVSHTYGYVTKNTRIRAGLEKSHAVDARCISGNPKARPAEELFRFRKLRRHNRKVMKSNLLSGGRWKRNQSAREINGFRLFDTVLYNGYSAYVHGRRTSGYFEVKNIEGETLSKSANSKKLVLVRHNNAYMFNLTKNGTPNSSHD